MAFPLSKVKPGTKTDQQTTNTEGENFVFEDSLFQNVGFNSYYKTILEPADPGLLGGNIRGLLFNHFGYSQAETYFRDPQVTAAFNAFALPILAKTPIFLPSSDDQKALDMAAFFNWALCKFKGSPIQLMYDMLTSKYFANSKIEKRFALMKEGVYKNKYYYTSFHKKRSGLWAFVYDEETQTDIIGIQSLVDPNKQIFNLEKFIVTYGLMLDDNPNGQGDYEKIAKFVTAKNEILILLLALAAKQSNAVLPILKTKTGTQNALGLIKALFKKIKEGLGIALPPNFEIELHDFKTDNTQWFVDILKWLDSQIALAIIGNSLSINESQGAGTHAQSKVHAETGTKAINKLWESLIKQIFIEQFMKPLIYINFDPLVYTEEFYPKFELIETVSEATRKEILDWLKVAQDIELMDFNSQTDFNYARDILKLPHNDDLLESKASNQVNSSIDAEDQKIIQMVKKLKAYGVTTQDIMSDLQTRLEENVQANAA